METIRITKGDGRKYTLTRAGMFPPNVGSKTSKGEKEKPAVGKSIKPLPPHGRHSDIDAYLCNGKWTIRNL